MQINFFLTMAIAGIIPMIVGSIWYNPKVFGNAWMQTVGVSEEKLREGFNPLLVFGLAYVLSVFIAFALSGIVIHQMGFFGMLQNHFTEEATQQLFGSVMQTYGNEFRTFKHGALHGAIAGIGLALPMVTTNALFERKGFKYIAINSGYWIVCLILMGGFICQFADLNSLG
ncbi:MAG: DUF1761 domain-containing protein [Sphingobacteriales bacterium]|nr:MAG: DUF1761 domain-containing protein [Sphingobacteriales bacterium]